MFPGFPVVESGFGNRSQQYSLPLGRQPPFLRDGEKGAESRTGQAATGGRVKPIRRERHPWGIGKVRLMALHDGVLLMLQIWSYGA